jgi:hypothetical protein
MRGYSRCAEIFSSIGVDWRSNRPFLKRGERPTPASAAAGALYRRGDSVRAADDEARGESLVGVTLGGRRASIAFLTDRLLAILEEMKAGRTSDYLPRRASYASAKSGHGVRNTAYTAHGFRSSFRDWAGNETHYPRELAEHAPAHVIGDKPEQAYRRSDALARQRELMDARAWHCEGADGYTPMTWPCPARPSSGGSETDSARRRANQSRVLNFILDRKQQYIGVRLGHSEDQSQSNGNPSSYSAGRLRWLGYPSR